MINTIAIFGQAACNHFDETDKVPSKNWLIKNEGDIKKLQFRTKAEYDAYCQGVENSQDWYDARILEPEYSKTPDCKECNHWRSFFSKKKATVYCPDCGKMLYDKIPTDTIKFNGRDYPIREICLGDDIGKVIVSVESLNDALMNDGDYVSEEARQEDEKIYTCVGREELRLPEEDLIIFIHENNL